MNSAPHHLFTRRSFMKAVGGTGAALSLGIQINGCTSTPSNIFAPNAWITITPLNEIIISITKGEMGQGVLTTIPQVIAEELEASWDQIQVELVSPSSKFGSMYTGGSSSVRSLWTPLREAGATARQMLIQAAAARWQINEKECIALKGFISNRVTNERLSYGELCSTANSLPIPHTPKLKPLANMTLIGRDMPSINNISAVNGTANYGIDTDIEGMVYAAIRHAPVFGSVFSHIENDTSKLITGVIEVIQGKNFVAVIADSYWLAQKTLNSFDIKWTPSPKTTFSQEDIVHDFKKAVNIPGEIVHEAGERPNTIPSYELKRDYSCGYQAHATMEPMNCTVHIHDDGCDIWIPTQDATAAKGVAAAELRNSLQHTAAKLLNKLGISDSITVHPTLMGGGFGRRLQNDYLIEAIEIAKHVTMPVKLIWSREEDIQHDFYRPYTSHRLKAEVDGHGNILHWEHNAVGASKGKVTSNAIDLVYNMSHKSLRFTKLDHGIPTGYWRSVAYSHNTFAIECFIDDLARQAKIDPLQYRKKLTAHDERALNVLTKVESLSRWGEDHSMKQGVAFCRCFGSYIAMVSVLEVSEAGYTVKEIYCAVDCGISINPDTIKAQIEGGTIFGLNATNRHEIHIQQGKVKQHNFDDYQMLTLNEIPNIHIELIKSDQAPGGAGEVAVPTVAPSIANALFSERQRDSIHLPFALSI